MQAHLFEEGEYVTSYSADVIQWSTEQAAFIRAGRFDLLDLEHIADEIEDMGKSEQREFENRMAILLAHLIKWQYQPSHRGKSWGRIIKNQRIMIMRWFNKTPRLKSELDNADFWLESWADAARIAENETGILNIFPDTCPWSCDVVLSPDFWPNI